MATTPVAALMFRFNNPDALLVLLLTAGAYCLTRALERASTRWLVALGVTIGFGFLAKMGEALLVVPAFAWRLPARRAHVAAADACSSSSAPARPWWSAPAGGCWPSPCGRPAPGP